MAHEKNRTDPKEFIRRRRYKGLEAQNWRSSDEPGEGSSSTQRARKYKRILASPEISYSKYNQLSKAKGGGKVTQIQRLSMRRLEIKYFYGAATERLLRFDDAKGQQKIGWFELMFHIPSEVNRMQKFSDPLPSDPDEVEILRVGFFQSALAAVGIFDPTTGTFVLDAKWGEDLSKKLDAYRLDKFGEFMEIHGQAMSRLFGKKLEVKSLASKVRSLLNMLGLSTKPVIAKRKYDVLYELKLGIYIWMEGIVRRREKFIWGEDDEN